MIYLRCIYYKYAFVILILVRFIDISLCRLNFSTTSPNACNSSDLPECPEIVRVDDLELITNVNTLVKPVSVRWIVKPKNGTVISAHVTEFSPSMLHVETEACNVGLNTTTVSRMKRCMVASSASLFNTKTYRCYGSIIKDGDKCQSTDAKNPVFGLLSNSSVIMGYTTPSALETKFNISQLITGVVWLVRNGRSVVEQSLSAECGMTQESGTLNHFGEMKSARVALGLTKDGNLMMIHIEGKSNSYGMSLFEFADLLHEYNVTDAINLDGGGSSTLVVNGTIVNYPSDQCKPVNGFNCERQIGSILCIRCPGDCSDHGDCWSGVCQCHQYYSGNDCSTCTCPLYNPTCCRNNGYAFHSNIWLLCVVVLGAVLLVSLGCNIAVCSVLRRRKKRYSYLDSHDPSTLKHGLLLDKYEDVSSSSEAL